MRKLTTGLLETTTTRLYHEVREADGPLVLMISGATGDAGHFDEVASRLADTHTIVTYDRRGNSRSPRTGGPTTMDEQADDAAALLRALDRGPAIVFGTSGGAIIALATLLRHPDLVAAAILHEPPLAAVVPEAHVELAAMKNAIAEVAQTRGPVAALEAFIRSQAGAAYDAIADGTRARMLGNADTLFGSELDAFVTWQPDEAALARVRVPVRVLIGTETTPLFGATTQWLAQRLRVTVGQLPGGHTPYFDRPQVMADALRPLLRELSR